MTKPVIAIDIDDVIAEGTGYLIESVNKRHSLSLTADDYHSVGGDFWGYYERVWQTHGVGHIVNYKDAVDEMRLDQSEVPLLAGAEFAVHELAKRFHIVFITARPKEWEGATRRWFGLHFSNDDIELYFAGDHFDASSQTKGKQARALGAKLLIDDNPSNCQTALDDGIEAILFGEYGWQGSATNDMLRCKDWPAVLEYLDGTEF